MKNTNQTAGKTATESIGVTEMQPTKLYLVDLCVYATSREDTLNEIKKMSIAQLYKAITRIQEAEN